MTTQKKPHVIFIPLPLQSHIKAMLKLAQLLVKTEGHNLGISGDSVNSVVFYDGFKQSVMWETCNNLAISWIMSSVSESIAKSVMFIGTASEIWSKLETRFSLSNGSRKYKLSKDTFGISQQGSSVSEYYTRMKCVWEELDSMNNLPRLVTITPEISVFLNAVKKQKEEQRLFQFLNGLDDCYGAQRSQLLLMNPLLNVENACAVIQQEESQKDVFHGSTVVESTALYSKNSGKDKCSICSYKWHPPEKCWEKVGYPVWHHKYKQPGKSNQSRGNAGNSTHKRTAANVTSGSSSYTFTLEQFENLMRSVLKDMRPGATAEECTDDDLEFVAVTVAENVVVLKMWGNVFKSLRLVGYEFQRILKNCVHGSTGLKSTDFYRTRIVGKDKCSICSTRAPPEVLGKSGIPVWAS
ncbi:hypothetical protein CTI12_AA190480 [Artemisia annua]|uniref:Retrotransposon gag domain-containing protein n=1 Tax=Artemisia annua TaxID=35608 RepID=A0A2U1P5W3_ARTAN|nr:hypothetical protein CTI12_AA190480 [Artemisia annua]